MKASSHTPTCVPVHYLCPQVPLCDAEHMVLQKADYSRSYACKEVHAQNHRKDLLFPVMNWGKMPLRNVLHLYFIRGLKVEIWILTNVMMSVH